MMIASAFLEHLRTSCATMSIFFRKRFTPIGVNQMQKDISTLPTVTTSSFEEKTNLRSSRRQLIYDGLTYPALQLSYCLTGPLYDRVGFKSWLGRADCRLVEDPAKADFVIFTGGVDVDPTLYNERCLPGTFCDPERDAADILMYKRCIEEGIPMVGICRGAQFLWVMQGGKLWQDIADHNDGEHIINLFGEKTHYRASSVHHQAVRPEGLKGMRLLATAEVSSQRSTQDGVFTSKATDFEIWAFPDSAILCIQGHPEYDGYPNYSQMCASLIDKYVYENAATRYVGGRIRVGSDSNVENK